jgi:hypothetical protein
MTHTKKLNVTVDEINFSVEYDSDEGLLEACLEDDPNSTNLLEVLNTSTLKKIEDYASAYIHSDKSPYFHLALELCYGKKY